MHDLKPRGPGAAVSSLHRRPGFNGDSGRYLESGVGLVGRVFVVSMAQ